MYAGLRIEDEAALLEAKKEGAELRKLIEEEK